MYTTIEWMENKNKIFYWLKKGIASNSSVIFPQSFPIVWSLTKPDIDDHAKNIKISTEKASFTYFKLDVIHFILIKVKSFIDH